MGIVIIPYETQLHPAHKRLEMLLDNFLDKFLLLGSAIQKCNSDFGKLLRVPNFLRQKSRLESIEFTLGTESRRGQILGLQAFLGHLKNLVVGDKS